MSELAVNIFSKTESRWLNEKILEKLETTSQRFAIPAGNPKKIQVCHTNIALLPYRRSMGWSLWQGHGITSTGKRHALCQILPLRPGPFTKRPDEKSLHPSYSEERQRMSWFA